MCTLTSSDVISTLEWLLELLLIFTVLPVRCSTRCDDVSHFISLNHTTSHDTSSHSTPHLLSLYVYIYQRKLSLLVSQLCSAAAHTPSAVTLHCEQVLCDVSRFDPPRFIQVVLPYTATTGKEGTYAHVLVHVHMSILCLYWRIYLLTVVFIII